MTTDAVAQERALGRPTHRVEGEVNLSTFAQQRQAGELAIVAAAEQAEKALDIDFAGVTAANSLGVALMTAWFRFAQTRGCELRILELPKGLQLIVEFSGLSEVLPLVKPP